MNTDGHARIPPRRREVLGGVARGMTNKEIARELGISEQAVKMQVSVLLHQFEVTTRTALVRVAADLGVVRLR